MQTSADVSVACSNTALPVPVVLVSLLRIGWLYLHKDLLSSFFTKSKETFTESVSLPLRRNFVELKMVTNYIELLTKKHLLFIPKQNAFN